MYVRLSSQLSGQYCLPGFRFSPQHPQVSWEGRLPDACARRATSAPTAGAGVGWHRAGPSGLPSAHATGSLAFADISHVMLQILGKAFGKASGRKPLRLCPALGEPPPTSCLAGAVLLPLTRGLQVAQSCVGRRRSVWGQKGPHLYFITASWGRNPLDFPDP